MKKLLPQKLKADVWRFRNGVDHWIAFVGIKNSKPLAFFSCINEDTVNNCQITDCTIEIFKGKEGAILYNVEYINLSSNVISIKYVESSAGKEFRNYNLFISVLLQNKVPVADIYDTLIQCGFADFEISSWQTGILRILSCYLPEDIKEASELKCPECAEGRLEIHYGCYTCYFCGYSKS